MAVLVGRRELASVGLGDVLGPAGEPRVVLVDIRSYAPLPDLTLARAQLCAAGHARPACARERAAAGVALGGVFGSAVEPLVAGHPDRVLLIVDVADCELHWPEGCVRIPATDYVAGRLRPAGAGTRGPPCSGSPPPARPGCSRWSAACAATRPATTT